MAVGWLEARLALQMKIFSNFTKLNSHLTPLTSDHLIIFHDNDDYNDDDDVCSDYK